MNRSYEKDLDLNLLRVFVVVAEEKSVTAAASRLYLTQPAVSAALRRLATAVGAQLFVRAGRGLELTARGRRLFAAARPHLEALIGAAVSPAAFDPKTSERTIRIGLSDTTEAWLLPPLLAALSKEAPHMRIIVRTVQFRTIADALSSGAIDFAVTVADELPADVRRTPLLHGDFVCLFDPRHVRLGTKPSIERYLAEEHVIVSYNGDLRGIVEDVFGLTRTVRVSVPTFQSIGSIVDGSALVATIPRMVAHDIVEFRPHLRMAEVPLELAGTSMDLLWRSAVDDDDAVTFVRGIATRVAAERSARAKRARRKRG
jgi:LysR family transcriptional activator of mexEF-oprN operon